MPTIQLGLDILAANQVEAELNINNIVERLDAFSQLSVKDKDLNTPPGSPGEGDRYHIGGSPSGAWSGQGGDIAISFGGVWYFFTPKEGWIMYVDNENLIYAYNGSSWDDVTGGLSETKRADTWVQTSSEDKTVHYVNVAVTLTEMAAVIVNPTTGTPSVSWTMRHNTDRNATGNEVITGGSTTTNTTTGHKLVSFNDGTVSAGSWIWIETSSSNLVAGEHMHVTIRYTED
jgi:hypothetical protein